MDLLFDIDPSWAMNQIDKYVWNQSTYGGYTSTSTCKWLSFKFNHDSTCHFVAFKWLWKLKIPKKIRIMFWLILHNSLSKNSTRFHRNLVNSSAFPHCSNPREDSLHCLRDFPHAKEIWLGFGFAPHLSSLPLM